MRKTNRVVIGFTLSLIVVFSVIGVALLYYNSNSLTIHFIPDHSNTIPDDVAWFLVAIESNIEITDYIVEIHTNSTIETDYVFWSVTPLLEVFLYPNSSHIDTCIEIEVIFGAESRISRDTAQLFVLNWTASELSEVIDKRDVFVEYLSNSHPEFGINETTFWTPIYNCAGILVVGHYLFLSEQWEMEISWHVMIPPYDWVQVYLRQRSDLTPSWAGQIDSWSTDNETINELDPPESIYRPM